PTQIVISGASAAVERIRVKLEGRGIRAVPLNVSHAFHSPLMAPILDEFERAAAGLKPARAKLRLVSNVSGTSVQGDELDARYWRGHLMAPVRFRAGIEELRRAGYRHFVEIGPQPVLCALGEQCFPSAE